MGRIQRRKANQPPLLRQTSNKISELNEVLTGLRRTACLVKEICDQVRQILQMLPRPIRWVLTLAIVSALLRLLC